ncbi:MAG: hypothetical protein HY069_03650 [Chlamydiia bacterium]|nr:hypothetical protein [Chlamydiia bacterium]
MNKTFNQHIRQSLNPSIMGHRTLSQLLRYSNLDAKHSKKFSDHISERILKGSAHE